MRYRKIMSSMYADARFISLPNNVQYLWIYLLTGPHTTNLPGLFRAGKGTLAENHRVSVEEFSSGFELLSSLGMVEASWDDLVVMIPNVMKYNPPASPNVVLSWTDSIQEIPECALKDKYIEHIGKALLIKGKAFAKAFAKALPEGLRQALPKGFRILCQRISDPLPNQEQEQEQETGTGRNKSVTSARKEVIDHSEKINSLMARYDNHTQLITEVFSAVASTRERGTMADSVRVSMLTSWESYPVPVVITAIEKYLAGGYAQDGKGEKYLQGIVRGQAKDKSGQLWAPKPARKYCPGQGPG